MHLIKHNHSKCSGDVIIIGPDGNITFEGPTMTCCHCGDMWIMIKGSGKQRGFCMKCMNVTCGKESCNICTPIKSWQ